MENKNKEYLHVWHQRRYKFVAEVEEYARDSRIFEGYEFCVLPLSFPRTPRSPVAIFELKIFRNGGKMVFYPCKYNFEYINSLSLIKSVFVRRYHVLHDNGLPWPPLGGFFSQVERCSSKLDYKMHCCARGGPIWWRSIHSMSWFMAILESWYT